MHGCCLPAFHDALDLAEPVPLNIEPDPGESRLCQAPSSVSAEQQRRLSHLLDGNHLDRAASPG